MSTATATPPIEQKLIHRCPVCMEPFWHSFDAARCCRTEIVQDVTWTCGDRRCGASGMHETEQEAKDCLTPPTPTCTCGHLKQHHAVHGGSWPGCYDLDCRCPQFERGEL